LRILPAYQRTTYIYAMAIWRLSNSAKVRACAQFLPQSLQARA
jgi:LysR family transcriptional activator of dmlA